MAIINTFEARVSPAATWPIFIIIAEINSGHCVPLIDPNWLPAIRRSPETPSVILLLILLTCYDTPMKWPPTDRLLWLLPIKPNSSINALCRLMRPDAGRGLNQFGRRIRSDPLSRLMRFFNQPAMDIFARLIVHSANIAAQLIRSNKEAAEL